MKLEYVKQIPPGDPPHELRYDVDGDRLEVAHIEGDTVTHDTFDFSGTPDGRLDVDTLETDLPVNPILGAERVDGELTVTVLDWSRE